MTLKPGDRVDIATGPHAGRWGRVLGRSADKKALIVASGAGPYVTRLRVLPSDIRSGSSQKPSLKVARNVRFRGKKNAN